MKNHTAVLPTAQGRLPAPFPFQSGSSGSPIRKAVHLGEADRFSYRQRRAEAEGGLSLPHGLVGGDHLGRAFEEKLAVAQQAGITIADGLVPLLAFITMKLAGLPSSAVSVSDDTAACAAHEDILCRTGNIAVTQK